jgi:hypothetical protein
MKLLLSDFQAVSFHDSPLREIDEDRQRIRLSLDFAVIRPPLEVAAGRSWRLTDCTLECLGVQRSEKEEWTDTVRAKPHSNPERPIEEIQHEEVADGCLVFSGFTQSKNWSVWRIEAPEFLLTWKAKREEETG